MKQQYIELRFPVKKIITSSDLNSKLQQLVSSPEIHRLVVDVEILSRAGKVVLSTDAILDTGAPVSLLPKSILRKLQSVDLIPHTFWGIVDKPECHVKTEMGIISMRFRDLSGKLSPILDVPVAFASQSTLPHIIGLKGIIEQVKIVIDNQTDEFSLIFSETNN